LKVTVLKKEYIEATSEKPHRHFIEADGAKQILLVALYAFILNIGLSVLKAIIAFFTGSLAVVASAVDSTIDSVASLAVLFGLKLSIRKTKAFPYGLYKIENLISVIVSLFIFIAGYEIFRRALTPATEPIHITPWIIGWLLVGVLFTLLFGQYAVTVGKRMRSPALIAEGRHRHADVLSSIFVLLAVILNYFNVKIDFWGLTIDQIAAGLVVLFIGYAGWELLSDGMRVLLDASLAPEILDKVQKIIESEPMVTEILWLTGRNAGRFCFLEADVRLRTIDLKKAEKISLKIEQEIRQQVPLIERVLIHYQPYARTHLNIAVPLADTTGKVSTHFGDAPYFAFIVFRLADRWIVRQEIMPNPHTEIPKAKGIHVAEWLVEQKVDIVVAKENLHNKKGPSYVFADAGVECKVTDGDDLSIIIEAFRTEGQH
jgi:cation diffusion facilitator family transporter